MRRLLSVLIALLIPVVGCSDVDLPPDLRSRLNDAETYELLSLDPSPSTAAAEHRFHGYEVLGRTLVEDPSTRRRINEALRSGLRESDGSVAACFNPRHGIRLSQGGKVTDFVICFECLQAKVYGTSIETSFLTSASPQKVFDEVLTEASVPLPR